MVSKSSSLGGVLIRGIFSVFVLTPALVLTIWPTEKVVNARVAAQPANTTRHFRDTRTPGRTQLPGAAHNLTFVAARLFDVGRSRRLAARLVPRDFCSRFPLFLDDSESKASPHQI